jgi:hypothetical protein
MSTLFLELCIQFIIIIIIIIICLYFVVWVLLYVLISAVNVLSLKAGVTLAFKHLSSSHGAPGLEISPHRL